MDAPLLIADVPWLLYRSFFALPSSIVDGDGNQVGALLGTVNALLSLAAPEAGGIGVRAVAACMGGATSRRGSRGAMWTGATCATCAT